MGRRGITLITIFIVTIIVVIGLKFLNNTHVEAEGRGGKMYINNMETTYLDYLIKLSNTKNNSKIAVIGSSVTKGSGSTAKEYNWPSRLHQNILNKDKILSNSKLVNFGFSGFKAQDLLQENKVSQLISEKPDVIVFETSVINNFRQSQTMDETIFYIGELLRTIESELPNAKLVVISPNPILTEGKNDLGLTYQDYIKETKEYIERTGYNYIDIYAEMNTYLSNHNISLREILADEIHPNDEGYQIWAEILFTYFEHVRFTI